jgi:hypothetical protein
MKKKKKKAKQWLSWRFRFFRLTLLMWVTLLAIPIFEAGLRIFFNIEIFWYFEYSGLLGLVPLSAALLLSYLTPVIWIWRTHHSWIPQIVKANLFVLTIFGIFFVGGLALPSPRGPYHLATAKMDDHVYYLGYVESRKLSSIRIMGMYRCDYIGLFCTRVCDYPMGQYHSEQFGLLTDPQTQSVFLTLDDAVVCPHY